MSKMPYVTLFMLMSIDGKISTGYENQRDFDKDLPSISGVSEGLQQYYNLEKQTDIVSFNSGKVMAKVGWNEDKKNIERIPVSFIVIDNQPHLTKKGILNLLERTAGLYIVTTNKGHPARSIDDDNLYFMYFKNSIDFVRLFKELNDKGMYRITVQSGGELNSILIREGLVNELSLVVAPIIVGGAETPTLVDGKSLIAISDLSELKALELINVVRLENSYLHLRYKVQ
ncbi:dihydrofolate reductase family protein [Candidatus Saccharibacteria bacterium]|nr:dihydrofolate reductase family protein [Candidatus Saccharibacteria bacterium]